LNEIEVVKAEVMTIPDQAKLILVRDQESLERANSIFITIKGLRKKIEETFSPIISKAFAAHKEAVAQRKKVEEPLILAESWLNAQVTEYHKVQERIRAEEERRLREAAIKAEVERRKAEEEARIKAAAELEAAGAKEEAEAVMAEALEEVDKPMEVYVPPPETPKVTLSGATVKTTWTFEIVNEALIPRQFLTPDIVKIGGIVRSLKGQTNIPGVKAVEKKSMVATGR
jgi:hypothetical protein